MPKFSDERIRDILRGRRAFRTIDFPAPRLSEAGEREPVRVAVRLLSDLEIDHCRVEAQRRFRDYCKRSGWDPAKAAEVDPGLHERLVERMVISRAFFDAETIASEKPEPFFASERELEQLDAETIRELMRAYVEHAQWVNPSAELTAEEADELAEALGKGEESSALLGTYAHGTLLSLCISLASRLRSK